MMITMNRSWLALTLSALALILAASPTAEARVAAIGPLKLAAANAQPEVVSPMQAATEKVACDQPKCCPQPCIIYHELFRCRKVCCDCQPPVKTVLRVKNPASCCEVDVPICLPACCTGEPTVCARCGICDRGIVDYQWCCGFKARIVFRACGDVVVTTIGG